MDNDNPEPKDEPGLLSGALQIVIYAIIIAIIGFGLQQAYSWVH